MGTRLKGSVTRSRKSSTNVIRKNRSILNRCLVLRCLLGSFFAEPSLAVFWALTE
jgi:hypothetical protein